MLPGSRAAIFLAMAVAATSACVQSVEDGVKLNLTADEDPKYAPAYTKATRKADAINNFEMKYKVSATYLSPDFRAAMAQRMVELFGREQQGLEEVSTKAGFLVTVFSPNPDSIDLTKQTDWSIFLSTGQDKIPPILVKEIRDKLRWQPFFPSISQWTREFLVVFDAAAPNPGASALLKAPEIQLGLANADARTTLSW